MSSIGIGRLQAGTEHGGGGGGLDLSSRGHVGCTSLYGISRWHLRGRGWLDVWGGGGV